MATMLFAAMVQAQTGADVTVPFRPSAEPQAKESSTALTAGTRAVLYEEDTADPKGKSFAGTAVWSSTNAPSSAGLLAPAARAEITIPEQGMTARLTFQRNTDPSLPASHTIDIKLDLASGVPHPGIKFVPGVLLKANEQARGEPLAGQIAKVTDGVFLFGLSGSPDASARNIRLMRDRSWIDLPMVYEDGRRAILAVEKGTSGQDAVRAIFAEPNPAPGEPPPSDVVR